MKADKLANIMNDYRNRALELQALERETQNMSYAQRLKSKLMERHNAGD